MSSTTRTAKAASHKLHAKPRLNIWQIFTMSFGFFGIQFGFALQNGNTSRILRSFGADVDQLPLFWIVAPLVGMIVQPLIGHYSDKTWNRLGRRKPYFLTGALLSSAALIFLPNSGSMAGLIPALWIGAGMVMVMDASFNIAMEPFRALVADNLARIPTHSWLQHTNFSDWIGRGHRLLPSGNPGRSWIQYGSW